MTDEILFDQRGSLGIVTLNRPAALNAQNLVMVQALDAQLTAWETDGAVTTLFIHGAGEKAFCAGGDIRALWQDNPENQMAFFDREYGLCDRLRRSRLKIVAYMDGITMGGGVGLSINANVRLATPKTLWAMPEVMIGFFPDIAASHFLPRNALGPAFGRYLALAGARLMGADCLAANIATHYVESGIDETLIGALASGGSLKSFIKPAPESGMIKLAAELAPHANAPLPDFLDQLRERGLLPADASPTSQQLIDALLRVGARIGYAEAVALDLRIVRHFLTKNSTFAEGVRARLIDRDQRPNWLENPPASLTDIDISRYFA